MPLAGRVGPSWKQGCDLEQKLMKIAARLNGRLLLLEPAHGVEDAELLPSLPEDGDARGELVLVAQVDEGEVL